VPIELRAAQRDIDRWRASNERRRRIPESFWQRATQLAQQHGINRVARAMRLSHEGLKARVESDSQPQEQPPTARFVELTTSKSPAAQMADQTGLTLRLHDGAKRWMQVSGADWHSAASVVCAFFGEVGR